jgi:small subunit ribosomal protein S5
MAFDTSEWTPRTQLGEMVKKGLVTSIDEIFARGYRIMEPEIADALLPDIQYEIIYTTIVQKQTDAGEKSRFKVVVAVGNGDGYIGIGSGKAAQWRVAVEKSLKEAKLNMTPVRRGCGSWECSCDQPHSVPFKVVGKCGSVRFEILPGPRGLGLVANDTSKILLRLAGIKDCWTKSRGSTRTTQSLIYATFDALASTYRIVTPSDWVR